MSITIQGLNGANILDSTTIDVSSTSPTLETFNWTGLTEVTFNSFGGTRNPNFGGTGAEFVLDNLTITPEAAAPEPGGMALFGGGLVLVMIGKRRRLRRALPARRPNPRVDSASPLAEV